MISGSSVTHWLLVSVSQDDALLEYSLRQGLRNANVIKTTVERLPTIYVLVCTSVLLYAYVELGRLSVYTVYEAVGFCVEADRPFRLWADLYVVTCVCV